jgi:hypothetical protein
MIYAMIYQDTVPEAYFIGRLFRVLDSKTGG